MEGVIDPAEADFIRGAIEEAEGNDAAVILQIDSRGSFGDEAVSLADFIRGSSVPVVAWVGPSGARAAGGALFVVYSSSLVAVAPGAGIGPARPFDLGTSASREEPGSVRANSRRLQELSAASGASSDAIRRLVGGAVFPAQGALDAGAAEVAAPSISALLAELDGRRVATGSGDVTMDTDDSELVDVRFHDMGPGRRVLHAVSTPAAVYLLLVLGLWGVAFELTQPGLGFAGMSGALSLSLAAYGLTVIPVHWLGLGVLLAGMLLQGIDVVIRRVAWLTFIGTGLFAAGSLLAWRGVSPEIDLAVWLVVLLTLGGFLFFGFGLTVALKARERVRSTQVGLVGLTGEARGDLDPEGAVVVKGAVWRARSSDGPIPKGTRIRVRGIDGLILRVEEEPGAEPE